MNMYIGQYEKKLKIYRKYVDLEYSIEFLQFP